jgi:hypothetical protein
MIGMGDTGNLNQKQYTESASSIDLKVTRLSNLDVLVGGKK